MLRFIEFFLWIEVLVQWCQDLWMFWEIGNSYGSNERLLKALRINNEEVFCGENIDFLYGVTYYELAQDSGVVRKRAEGLRL